MTRFGVIGLFILGLVCLDTVQGRKGLGSGEQEWGFAQVRPGAHMFWWLYYTSNANVTSYYEKPLVLWLQGGPGGSSTGYGNFEELGPLDLKLKPRNYTWVNDYNVLFIDNPVGTGFSYVKSERALTRNNSQIAKDLVEMMRSFYKNLPQFKKVPTYITCESYGGKMAAEFALEWYKAERSGSIESNLKGVGLGDSWISPIDSVLTWAPFLLQTGMVDSRGYNEIKKAADETRKAVETGRWNAATNLWAYTELVVLSVTENIDFYNILTKVTDGYLMNDFENPNITARAMLRNRSKASARAGDEVALDNLMNNVVKKALNLTVNWGAQKNSVFSALQVDFMKPATKVVERLLEETDLKVFVYTGQLDLIVDTPGTLLWTEKLNWKHSKQWRQSNRTAVTVNGIIEGYRKSYGNLSFYWVNRAGHMVPADNPVAMAAILKELINV